MNIKLPDYIDPEAWAGFCDMRAAKGKRVPFTPRAASMILKTLAELHEAGHDANASLDQSTLNGWSGVYEPKQQVIRKLSTAQHQETKRWIAEHSQTPEVTVDAKGMLQRAKDKILRRVS